MAEPRCLSLRVVRIQEVIHAAQRVGMETLIHRLPSQPPDPDGGLPSVCTFGAAPSDQGTIMLTSPQLPGVALFGDSEDDALVLVRLAIREALAFR